MSVPHRHQARLATCMHQEEASHWWKSLEKTTFVSRTIESVTWAEFVAVFNRQYFPEPVRQRKALEFNTLMQGDGSVLEYAKKFLALERFAPGVVTGEKARADKYFWGLKAELRDKIATSPRNTFTEVNDAATTQEMVMDYDKSQKQAKATTHHKLTNQITVAAKPLGQPQQVNHKRKREEPPYQKCRNCGRMHAGWCREPLKCFNCGREGHMKRDCRFPMQNQQLEMSITQEHPPIPNTDKGKIFATNVTVDVADQQEE